MAFTFDLTTNLGKVRLLIVDKDSANPIFQDNEIDYFLTAEGSNVKRAAALAYETIAGNQAFVLKVIKLLSLSTNGEATARSLLAVAQRFRDQAAYDESTTSDNFDYAEVVYDDFTARQRLLNQIERLGI